MEAYEGINTCVNVVLLRLRQEHHIRLVIASLYYTFLSQPDGW